MKKLVTLLLVGLLAFSMIGCGDSGGDAAASSDKPAGDTTPSTPTDGSKAPVTGAPAPGPQPTAPPGG